MEIKRILKDLQRIKQKKGENANCNRMKTGKKNKQTKKENKHTKKTTKEKKNKQKIQKT